MSQVETYKKSLRTFNERCENDAAFAALVKESPEKALSEVGVTDVKAFLEFSLGDAMSDSEVSAISGGFGGGIDFAAAVAALRNAPYSPKSSS